MNLDAVNLTETQLLYICLAGLGLSIMIIIKQFFGYRLTIKRLNETLIEEKNKRIIPKITPVIDFEDFSLRMKNIGNCDAKDISVEDINIRLDYEFKKELGLKFIPIDILRAGESVPLRYHIFDGKHEMLGSVHESLASHLANIPFDMKLTYTNSEDIPFTAEIAKDKDSFFIKSIRLM